MDDLSDRDDVPVFQMHRGIELTGEQFFPVVRRLVAK